MAIVPMFGVVVDVSVCTGVTNSCRYVWQLNQHLTTVFSDRSLIDVAVQTCTWIDMSSDKNDTETNS